jgi:hypothetical protein
MRSFPHPMGDGICAPLIPFTIRISAPYRTRPSKLLKPSLLPSFKVELNPSTGREERTTFTICQTCSLGYILSLRCPYLMRLGLGLLRV